MSLELSAQRERILGRFTEWLDEALEAEEPPAGIVAELLEGSEDAQRTCDLYSLWSATTTLAQEVKLQGRTFHALERAIADLPAEVAALRVANERLLGERRRELEQGAVASTHDLLLDLRERLERGLEAARPCVSRLEETPPRGRIARLFGGGREAGRGEAERALMRGYELTLARLDEGLRERGVEPLECLGRPFDPHTMRAVEVEHVPGAAPETVLEVLRSGYTLRGELLRVAEVKVSRGSAG